MTLPSILLICVTALFLCWERISPGRLLPNSKNWYFRALIMNAVQLAITLLAGKIWLNIANSWSFLNLSSINSPVLQGLIAWFIGTFIFYWWHRIRHKKGFWLIFHQIHHSASRIEILTSFYKHPIEIAVNTFITALVLFPILGTSLLASFWFNFFAATGEYFYHANIKTPPWLRYFIQTPELHSIHHQKNVHNYNFSDIPLWDRLFGTYKDTTSFTPECGFPEDTENKIVPMLLFKDVNS